MLMVSPRRFRGAGGRSGVVRPGVRPAERSAGRSAGRPAGRSAGRPAGRPGGARVVSGAEKKII